jgi:hypothetical protein
MLLSTEASARRLNAGVSARKLFDSELCPTTAPRQLDVKHICN